MNIVDQIEQGIVHAEVRNLTQGLVSSGDLSTDDQEVLVNAAWIIVTLALTLYGRAAAQGAS